MEIEIPVPAEYSDHLIERWPPAGLARVDASGGLPQPPPVRRVTITADQTGHLHAFVDGVASPGGWERLESELALFATERLAGLVAVNAAVIAPSASGPAIVVPGPSGAGKSSLCVAAHEAGATVLSDEFALVDPSSGQITGWSRPVRVRRAGGGVDRLALTSPTDPMPVGLIALVSFNPSTAGAAWRRISAADAVVGLLANTVCARSRPDEALDAALSLVRQARAVEGQRGEAREAVLALLDEATSLP